MKIFYILTNYLFYLNIINSQECNINLDIVNNNCYFILNLDNFAIRSKDIGISLTFENFSQKFAQVICLSFVTNPNGYIIEFPFNQLVLDDSEYLYDDVRKIVCWNLHLGNNQRWDIIKNDNIYNIISVSNGKKLASVNNSLLQYDLFDPEYQKFKFIPINNFCKNCKTEFGLTDGKCYYMINLANSFAVELTNGTSSDVLFTETNYNGQQLICINQIRYTYSLNFKSNPLIYLKIGSTQTSQKLIKGTSENGAISFVFIRRNINLFSIYSYFNKQPIGLINNIVYTVEEDINDRQQNWYMIAE